MRVITLNVNGIRAAQRKGFFPWAASQAADFLCLQEVRAQPHQLPEAVYSLPGYQAFWHLGERKGYAGVAILSRHKPTRVVHGLGWPDMDAEGRYLELQFPGLSIISLYVPSGSSSEHRQAVKFDFLDRFAGHLERLRRRRRQYVICGDWNIAHKAIDLKNWRSNQKNSGFLPQEREWMDRLFGPIGFVDAFRQVNSAPDQYTWWSNRGQSWAKNVGWRLDYQVITPGFRDAVLDASVYRQERFSDHAPLIMDYAADAWARPA